MGLIQLREQLLPMYSLGALLGHGNNEPDEQSRVLIVDTGSRTAGLLVDEVAGVSAVKQQSTEVLPAEVRKKQMAIDGVYRTEEQGLVFQLNVDALKGMLSG
ncbi:CheW-like domain protein [compost metagenome]